MLVTLAGYVALVVVVGRLLAYLSKYVKSPIKVKSLGDWALVTGATDGIGKSSIMIYDDDLLHRYDNFYWICLSLPLLKPILHAGKGFCLDLAKKGMNIVLVSRSKDMG